MLNPIRREDDNQPFATIYLLFQYSMDIIYPSIEFINKCGGVQNAISLQEEASIVILLRGKLRGRARKALHQ